MALPEEFMNLYFPYDDVRPVQDDLIRSIHHAVSHQENLIAHAPTGLGKTAAALAPAIKKALKEDLTIFFLTSRHTQHQLALKTFNDIKERHKLRATCVDIIGKKWLCLQPSAVSIYPSEFYEYCKKLKEDDACEYYSATKKNGEASKEAQELVKHLISENKTDTESVNEACKEHGLCPYEISLLIAKEAKVIVGDYFYLFSPGIRETFLRRTDNELKDIIIVIDEGHNLPARVKDLATHRISNNVLKRASDECKKKNREDLLELIEEITDFVYERGTGIEREIYISKERLLEALKSYDLDEITGDMYKIADEIREESKHSSLGTVASFLDAWQGEDVGYARILTKSTNNRNEEVLTLSYRCLDPAIITRDVIKSAYSTILMSGTLTPTSMYKAVLGFDSAQEKHFRSPFPESNRLNIIVPKTSTKYEKRNEQQYEEIAKMLARVTNKVPGNSAVFFPSYKILESVNKYYQMLSTRTIFMERQRMNKMEKIEFLENFKGYKNVGAVLLGVISGNFGEGIDLPGDYLKGVVIVGLPLQRPDLETEALIKYYDGKFGKGWDYGYLFPAFNMALQSAGRCIRTEKDKGIIVFLDERYTWNNYMRCFPPNWDLKVTLLFESMIERFFENSNNQ